mgnify:CR=1 FL=1|jgi:hypothetical protein
MTYVKYEGYDREYAKQSVGEGWASLIDEVFDMLNAMQNPPKIIQVKEKWGGLRIYDSAVYTTDIPTDFEKLIRDVEDRSFSICETCGKQGSLRKGSWMKTLCDIHAQGRERI